LFTDSAVSLKGHGFSPCGKKPQSPTIRGSFVIRARLQPGRKRLIIKEGFSPCGMPFLEARSPPPLFSKLLSRADKGPQESRGFSPRTFLDPDETHRTSRKSMLVAAAGVVGKVESALQLSTFSITLFLRNRHSEGNNVLRHDI
jgi:hypothetical protein